LKRFTVFNVAQCDGLPFDHTVQPKLVSQVLPIPAAEALIAATGAQFHRGGEHAKAVRQNHSIASRTKTIYGIEPEQSPPTRHPATNPASSINLADLRHRRWISATLPYISAIQWVFVFVS
jgi:hypothetical protein